MPSCPAVGLRPLLATLAVTGLATVGPLSERAAAQKASSRSLSMFTQMNTRQRTVPYSRAFMFESAAAFGIAPGGGSDLFAEDNEETVDGTLWFYTDSFTENDAVLDLYAGRDGAVLTVRDDAARVGSGQRLELFGRYSSFFREGFYDGGDDFVATGLYEGTDWGAYLGVGDSPAEDVFIEVGPYFRVFEFARTNQTPSNYIIPDNHFTWGGRIHIEQQNVALDRENGKPRQGFLLSATIEREQNESDRSFGVDPVFLSSLPDGLWRGRAHLEWYIPLRSATLEFYTDASISDEDDRIYNADVNNFASGQLWADAELRLRLDFGGLEIKPLAKARYLKTRGEFGAGEDNVLSFGGGLYVQYAIGDTFDLYADYSYLSDANRTPVSFFEDSLGEHQLFVGGRLRLGATRSF